MVFLPYLISFLQVPDGLVELHLEVVSPNLGPEMHSEANSQDKSLEPSKNV